MKRTVILAILDGWGLGPANETNPIHVAKPDFVSYASAYFPYCALKSSGISVGIPWTEPGNSEVGHLTIGAGKIVYQYLPKISMSIDDSSFFENPALKKAFTRAKELGSGVHLVGLLTKGSVHASLKHLLALIEMAEKEGQQKLYLHLITDGKDSPPRSGLNLIKEVESFIKKKSLGSISSIMGRYYAMNRDGSWQRTEKACEAVLGRAQTNPSTEDAIEKNYEKNLDDEYLEPLVINKNPIQDNDSVIFFNFREDSIRQFAEPFINPAFDKFAINLPANLTIVTMTKYFSNLENDFAFSADKVENPLGLVLSENNKTQLRLTETEKYAHVTYFFNGLVETPFPGEFRIIIPSDKSSRPENNPKMMSEAITERLILALKDGIYDFILVNFPNPDFIAHTGDFDATVKAIQATDKALMKITREVLSGNHALIVTSDHGNAESVLNLITGDPETNHNPNPVPFYLIDRGFQRENKLSDPFQAIPIAGLLSDVAPTVLDLMKLPQPKEMTGESLLPQLLQ